MIKSFAIKQLLNYLDADPEENIPKALKWTEKFVPNIEKNTGYQQVKEIAMDPSSNWYQFVLNLWTDLDKEVKKTLVVNTFLNSYLKWEEKRDDGPNKYGCSIPWAILMDPTSACNLKCTGCWAADYGNKLNLDFETLDSIVEQGKKLGIYAYIFSGGEPLVAKDRVLKLCEKHDDCLFLAFTNGTLIDEEFADQILKVKNFVPAISVEGFEEATDFRRGQGTFNKVVRAMDILKEKKLLFGVSCCYTSKNVDSLSSEEYFDWMIEKGAKFAWFFTFMPVGVSSTTELMVTPEQRKQMYKAIRKFRDTKPLFTMDFWNDGEYVHGCIAGGRNYMHINANGDVEPCAFIHYSTANIKDKTLLECLQSDLFKEYQKGQPFNSNHLRPCPLLDNPEKLKQMVDASHAYSTDLADREDVNDLIEKTKPVSVKWAPVADDLWEERQKEKQFWAEKKKELQESQANK